MEAPWNDPTVIVDDEGNRIPLGILPGVFSIMISTLIIIKGTLDLTGNMGFKERLRLGAYAMVNSIFRISSFALISMYLKYWSIGMYLGLFIANFVIMVRHTLQERSHFSVITSSVAAIFTPFAAFKDTDWMDSPLQGRTEDEKMAAKIAAAHRTTICYSLGIKTIPWVLVWDVLLLLLLVTDSGFKYPNDIILCSQTTVFLLAKIILPLGICALLSTVLIKETEKEVTSQGGMFQVGKRIKNIARNAGLAFTVLMAIGAISTGLITTPRANCEMKNSTGNYYYSC